MGIGDTYLDLPTNEMFSAVIAILLACQRQTYLRSSLLSLRKITSSFFVGREATTGNTSAVRRLPFYKHVPFFSLKQSENTKTISHDAYAQIAADLRKTSISYRRLFLG